MNDKADYSNDLVSFDIPIAGVRHALWDNVAKEWSARKTQLEERIAAGQYVKLQHEPTNSLDPWAIQAFYDYDGSGNWQPVGRVGTDHVCRVRALFGGKKTLTATLIRWEELNGHPDIPVGTIWAQVQAPRNLVEPNREMETIGKFCSPLSELLLPHLPVRQEEKNLVALCDDILKETDVVRLLDLARRYLHQMDTSFASDDRYYYLAIVHHLQSFTNEQLDEVTAAILHNRHNYDAKSKPLDIYRRQMEHVREAIQSAHGMAEQFCRMYDTDRKREELMDKLKEPLWHEFSRAFPIDCVEEEKRFANRLFYGRYNRTDLYAIYCHIALIEYLQGEAPQPRGDGDGVTNCDAIPDDCKEAVRKVIVPTFTLEGGVVLNSAQQIEKASKQIDLTSNVEVAMLMSVCIEVKAVIPAATCTDFVRALIGMRVVAFTDAKAISRMAGGMTKKLNGSTRNGKINPPLPHNHRQWPSDIRPIGDRLFETMRSQT